MSLTHYQYNQIKILYSKGVVIQKIADSQAICINTVRNALKRLNLPMRRAKPN
jgi:predicted DNA-binding protein YlxM (UPF0122 family)